MKFKFFCKSGKWSVECRSVKEGVPSGAAACAAQRIKPSLVTELLERVIYTT